MYLSEGTGWAQDTYEWLLTPTCGAGHFARSAWDCDPVCIGQRRAPAAYDPVSVTRRRPRERPLAKTKLMQSWVAYGKEPHFE